MRLRRAYVLKRWAAIGLAAYALGGCIASSQLTDFFTTEAAREASSLVGQLFLILAQTVTGNIGG